MMLFNTLNTVKTIWISFHRHAANGYRTCFKTNVVLIRLQWNLLFFRVILLNKTCSLCRLLFCVIVVSGSRRNSVEIIIISLFGGKMPFLSGACLFRFQLTRVVSCNLNFKENYFQFSIAHAIKTIDF